MLKKIALSCYGYLREFAWYIEHLIKGTTYAEYYATRMDRIVKKNPNWGLNLEREFQLNYLISHGLVPESSMLDYGCGALSAGVHFIKYLDAGNYVGVDISKGVLEEGKRRLSQLNLISKSPELYKLDGEFPATFKGRSFDFIWAQSVLTHMPPDDIERLLISLRPMMSAGTQFFATFTNSKDGVEQSRFKDWRYDNQFFLSLADKYDYELSFMSDWRHPDNPIGGGDILVRFTAQNSIANAS